MPLYHAEARPVFYAVSFGTIALFTLGPLQIGLLLRHDGMQRAQITEVLFKALIVMAQSLLMMLSLRQPRLGRVKLRALSSVGLLELRHVSMLLCLYRFPSNLRSCQV
jgi:hypothetical protein